MKKTWVLIVQHAPIEVKQELKRYGDMREWPQESVHWFQTWRCEDWNLWKTKEFVEDQTKDDPDFSGVFIIDYDFEYYSNESMNLTNEEI